MGVLTFAETVSKTKENVLAFAEAASSIFGTALSFVKTDSLRFVGDTEKSADGFLTYFGRFPDDCHFCVESFPLGCWRESVYLFHGGIRFFHLSFERALRRLCLQGKIFL